jgi:hypothetical protein
MCFSFGNLDCEGGMHFSHCTTYKTSLSYNSIIEAAQNLTISRNINMGQKIEKQKLFYKHHKSGPKDSKKVGELPTRGGPIIV